MAVQHDGVETPTSDQSATVAFVIEQTLGHVTHSENLRRLAPDAAAAVGLNTAFVPIPFEPGVARIIPGWGNWTIRSGTRAQAGLRKLQRRSDVDAMFVHTVVPATLLRRPMRRIPTVVSLDATPLQYDELGEFYAHSPGPEPVERLKYRVHRSTFRRAAHLVTWSTWTRDDLIDRYDVDPSRVTVIPPGVDVDLWEVGAERASGPLQILFVGGDLDRKGGRLLIDACSNLRSDPLVPEFVLHLVTGAPVEPVSGVVVHAGLTPNSPELRRRFLEADVFCLPTFGDCLPMVLAEAGASGLPLVSTSVGGITEIVTPGESGELVAPGDAAGLSEALRSLLTDRDRRRSYGAAARRIVERHHDARVNAQRIVDLIRSTLDVI